jgi:two-component system phosphate regulon response regulator PhoB/two-component system alkaline phosphatase synthesis response regulator PhoP
MNGKLIAIVDDDPDIIKSIGSSLKSEGFRVKGFSGAEGFFISLDKEKPDLILLDIVLPGVDGFEICKALKNKEKFSSIPIIMLSGKGGEVDKVSGLDAGSDDYIAKPFSINEIKARIRAVLRRHGAGSGKKVCIGGVIEMDLERYEVFVGKEKVELTPTEFRILECLSSSKGRVFTRKRILEFLWGEEKVVIERTIDVHIRHLREKLGRAEKFIKNVRGIGYKIEEDIE